MRLLVVLVLVLFVSVSGRQATADPVEHEYQVLVNGTQRTFYVYVPDSYSRDTKFPLVVFFHGMSDSCQSSQNFMIAGYTMQQQQRQFLLATACGINKMWSGPTDLPFAEAILDTVVAAYSVDPQRIFASGFSMGGAMTDYLGCRLPERFTGGLAVAAGWLIGDSMGSSKTNADLLSDCDALFAGKNAHVNMLKLHGSKDPVVVPYGATGFVAMRDDFYGWALRNGCKGSPTTVSEDAVYKHESFENCPEGVSVRLMFVYGIPHQWVQNATINYNTVILDQFKIVGAPQHPTGTIIHPRVATRSKHH